MKLIPVGASIARPSKHTNLIKKTMSLFLSLVMLLSITAGFDLSAYAATSGDFEYTVLDDGTAEITKYIGLAVDLTIPSNIDGYTVTSIGDYACYNNLDLLKVTISDSVTNIGFGSFEACDCLTSVTIPDSVISIDTVAFASCTSLENVTIPNSVTNIGYNTFTSCTSLMNFNVDNNNQYYSSQDGVLFNKDKTELIQYPAGNPKTAYEIPNGVKIVGDYAFRDCLSLTSIAVPSTVTRLYDDIYPSSIVYRPFLGCTGLTNIDVDNNNQYYSSQDGVLFNKEKTKLIQYPSSNTRISYEIPNSVKIIGDYAFQSCHSLTSVIIPDSVTSIYYDAFCDCSNLTNITIPDSVISIDRSVFYQCTSLESVTIPNSVTSISDWTFADCNSLTNVTIPNSITSIDEYAFYSCRSLTRIIILNSNCEINDNEDTISNTATIYGYSNSTAQEYAEKYNRNFLALDNYNCEENNHCYKYGFCILCGEKGPNYIIYINEPQIVNIENSGDYAYFQFTPESDGKYEFYSIGDYDTYGYLYDENMKEITHNDDSSGSNNFSITYNLEKDKTYIFACRMWNSDTTGNFNVILKKVEPEHVHGWNNGVVTTKATCKATGIKTYTCTECGVTKTETIAKISHTYKTTTTKATTSKNGSIVTKCTVCGNVLKNTTIYYPKTIKLSKTSYTYNGKVQTPSVIVKDSKGKTLKKNTDYTVTYAKGRKNVGKYTVTIKFKGNYSGTVKKTFTIKPKSTSISKLTPGKKKFTVKWKKQTSQTTGYQIQYSTSSKFKSAKTVTVSKNKTTAKTISKLKAKKKYYVRVRTYKTVNGTKLYSSWSKSKSVTTKK